MDIIDKLKNTADKCPIEGYGEVYLEAAKEIESLRATKVFSDRPVSPDNLRINNMAIETALTDLEKTLSIGGFAIAMTESNFIGRKIDKSLLGDVASDMFLKGMEYQKLLQKQKAA